MPDAEAEIRTRLKELGERVEPLVRARFPDIPRRVSGYNLDQPLPGRGPNLARALVGTEGKHRRSNSTRTAAASPG
jgi:hypothetical protein